MATYATLTIPVKDIIGENFNASRASVWIEPNVPVVLADSIRAGGCREQVVNGVATFANLCTTNSADNPTSFGYRVTITAPPKGAQKREDIVVLTTSDFPFTATANLKDIDEAWDNVSAPVSWRSDFRTEMEALQAATEAARDEAVEIAAGDIATKIARLVTVPAGTGVQATDDANLEAAAASVAPGGTVRLQAGDTYTFGKHTFTKAFTLDLNGATVNADPTDSGSNGGPLFYFAGSVGTQYAFNYTVVGDRAITTVTAGDAANFAAGDYVVMEDQLIVRRWDDAADSYAGRCEMNRVLSVNTGTGTLNLAAPVEWAYNTVPRIRKVTLLDRPAVLGGLIMESNPGATYSGDLYGSVAPHLVHFQYCESPQVRNVRVKGWNLQAFNFHRCMNPRAVDCTASDPFRPNNGAHGIAVRFDQCHSGRAIGVDSYGARHTVDHVGGYDGRSEGCTSYYNVWSAFLTHGLGSKRTKSVNDSVIGGQTNCTGWSHGNSEFAADYGFMVVNPSFTGVHYAAAQASGSTDMTIVNPDFHPSSYGILQTQGAKRLKVRGGVVELVTTLGGPHHVRSMQKASSGDATGLAPQDISVRGTTFLDAGTGTVVTTSENTGVVEVEDQAFRMEQMTARSGQRISTGIEVVDRIDLTGSAALTSGQVAFTMFDASKNVTVSQVITATRGTAGAGLTLARVGLYSVSSAGDLTLLASTTNDTAMWTGTFADYTKALNTSVALKAGRRYALGLLAVGTTMPSLYALAPNAKWLDRTPRPCAVLNSQANLPASTTNASLGLGFSLYGGLLTP